MKNVLGAVNINCSNFSIPLEQEDPYKDSLLTEGAVYRIMKQLEENEK